MPYHHGDLRRALLDAAAAAIAEDGVGALSLRSLAKSVGVSNAAPTYHFTDKAGLLTALATEGFELLADALDAAAATGGLLEMGMAYVEFAIGHSAHFQVMFQPGLYEPDDTGLRAAESRAGAALARGVDAKGLGLDGEASESAQTAAWSIVHGYASLVLSGAIAPADVHDVGSVLSHLDLPVHNNPHAPR